MAGHEGLTEYEEYLQREWLLFARDAARQAEALRGLEALECRSVLDVGTGAGQEMIPFAARGATCVGIDISLESGIFGSRLFTRHYPDLPAHFATATAEDLPFRAAAFDLVLCRVTIPYTDNRTALAEMSRVLRPGGVLLLKTHHPRYYTRKFVDGIRKRSPRFSIHALRVLLSGTILHLTGWQPSPGLLLRESFLTEGRLKKELARAGLAIAGTLPDSNPLTPSYRVVKTA
ncbi:MAG: class I SAM-dependent methyltransferase [Acidobacteriota bacterium]|nr:class I SAM-dependent methyltransferase [Acidobacteriota bacterium]